MFLIFIVYWGFLFNCASLPGNKMYAGLSYGIAEGISSLCCGVLCKYVKYTNVLQVATYTVIVCTLLFYYLCGGANTSSTAIMLNFVSVFAVGNLYCAFYILVQTRVPSEFIASTLSKAIAVAQIAGIVAMALSYLPQPYPTLMTFAPSVFILVIYRLIPDHSLSSTDLATFQNFDNFEVYSSQSTTSTISDKMEEFLRV